LLTCLVFIYFASYTYFTSTYFEYMPNMGKCAGEEFAAFAGCGIISSYLFLFISFYFATYKTVSKRAANKAVAKQEISLDPKFSDSVVDSIKINGNGKANGKANGASGRAPDTPGPVTRSRKA
jgi:fatty acid elongase 3